MTEKDRIYGNYLVSGRPALCIEDNHERVELHYSDEFTVLWRHSFDALKPVAVTAGKLGT
jgi:hypothetical protein